MGEPFPNKTLSETPSERRLDSWKEIATYLGRDVTTVQRWERQEGMPVHRHLHHKRGSVYALSFELDAWRQGRKLRSEEEQEPALEAAGADGRQTTVPRGRHWLILGSSVVVLAAIVSLAYFATRMRAKDASRTKIRSLAVLPLQNLSGDPSQDYVADGMTEELIGRLSRIHGLRVISRTSTMHFKNTQLSVPEIARMLAVDAIVEGSLVQEGHQIRVHAQLIRAATDEHIWAGEYQREYQSILEVQEEVARNIVEQIQLNLTPEDRARLASKPPVDPEAYESYLKGRYYFNQRTEDALHKSIASFQQAIARDTGYAPAYSGLAEAYAMLGFRGGLPSKDALLGAKKAALKAIELDDALAEPHASLAFIAETYEWDWPTAEREYKHALELNPGYAQAHNWYGGYLTYTGRFNEGVAEAMRARELDPLSLPLNNALAGRLLAAGRYDEALRQVQTTLELDEHFAPAHQTLGWVYLHGGKRDDAIREFQNALELAGATDTDIQLDLGFAYAVSGHPDEARRILAHLQQLHQQGIVPAASLATLYGALGESNEAFVWLEKAYQERDPQLTYLKAGRRFEPLREDPRFGQLVRRVGLPD
ncbi:MAG TPA: tetratricopeptide repeat protein [Candidatus Eremiobacteraceae bacterium]|nr:tetratricopeptide repeat protein [Candidatus Eremiobacteraceae bacterium]